MPVSNETLIRIAHASVMKDMLFSQSLDHWQRQTREDHSVQATSGRHDSTSFRGVPVMVIEGDCNEDLEADEGGLIHIFGNLNATIEVKGISEIIITGNAGPQAEIRAVGICRIFIGGRFTGRLHSADSLKVWIESDFDGILKTGAPHTDIYVGGNFHGEILPVEKGALLGLTVVGFASQHSLNRIKDYNYTQFHASIGISDVAPGLYPQTEYYRRISNRNSYNRWCVRTERQPVE